MGPCSPPRVSRCCKAREQEQKGQAGFSPGAHGSARPPRCQPPPALPGGEGRGETANPTGAEEEQKQQVPNVRVRGSGSCPGRRLSMFPGALDGDPSGLEGPGASSVGSAGNAESAVKMSRARQGGPWGRGAFCAVGGGDGTPAAHAWRRRLSAGSAGSPASGHAGPEDRGASGIWGKDGVLRPGKNGSLTHAVHSSERHRGVYASHGRLDSEPLDSQGAHRRQHPRPAPAARSGAFVP